MEQLALQFHSAPTRIEALQKSLKFRHFNFVLDQQYLVVFLKVKMLSRLRQSTTRGTRQLSQLEVRKIALQSASASIMLISKFNDLQMILSVEENHQKCHI